MSTEAPVSEEDDTEWRPAGARGVRSRTEANRIITLTGDALEESGFAEGTEVSLYTKDGEIRLEDWATPVPPAVAAPPEAEAGGHPRFRPAGVREIHGSGTSIIVTLTERALALAGFREGQQLQEWAREGTIKLTTDGPDVEEGEA